MSRKIWEVSLYSPKEVRLCRDPKDNMLLECCIEANANVLISGDKDLLEMDEPGFDFKIVTPKEFVNQDH